MSDKQLYVFIRSPSKRDKKLVKDMLATIDIREYNLIDVNAIDVSTLGQCRLGMAFGRICGRIVRNKTDQLLVFPSTSNLYKDPNNKEDRLKAQSMLETLKGLIDMEPSQDNTPDKSEALGAFLQTKSGSVYVSNMTHKEAIEAAHTCLTVDDLEYIDEIRSLFSADTMSIVAKD